MQPCSSLIGSLCSYIWVLGVFSQHLQLTEARALQAAYHVQTSANRDSQENLNQLAGASNMYTDELRLQNTAGDHGVLPVCSNAYAIINQPSLSSATPFWGGYLPVSIGGVTDPAGQHLVIAISKIEQNEPTYNQHSQDSCPDAQVNGLNSLFVRYESSEAGHHNFASSMQSGRTYFVNFTAKNEAGLSCDGMVRICVSSKGRSECLTTDNDIVYDSRICAPSIQSLTFSMDALY